MTQNAFFFFALVVTLHEFGKEIKSVVLLPHKETTLANGESLGGFTSRTENYLVGHVSFLHQFSAFQKLCLAPGSVTHFDVRHGSTIASLCFFKCKMGLKKGSTGLTFVRSK